MAEGEDGGRMRGKQSFSMAGGRPSFEGLAKLAATTRNEIHVPPGAEIMRQGESADSAFLVAFGLTKLWRSDADGRVAIVALRGQGWLLGLASIVLGGPSLVTATAVTRCRVLVIPSDQLRRCLEGDSHVAHDAMEALSQEVREQVIDRAELGTLSAGERLEQLLWSFAAREPGAEADPSADVELPVRLGELAQLLAVSPQYLSELLAKLRARGVIRGSGRKLVIVQPNLLRHDEEVDIKFRLSEEPTSDR